MMFWLYYRLKLVDNTHILRKLSIELKGLGTKIINYVFCNYKMIYYTFASRVFQISIFCTYCHFYAHMLNIVK